MGVDTASRCQPAAQQDRLVPATVDSVLRQSEQANADQVPGAFLHRRQDGEIRARDIWRVYRSQNQTSIWPPSERGVNSGSIAPAYVLVAEENCPSGSL